MRRLLTPPENELADYLYWPLYVRKSHIESFKFCPQQFNLQYVEMRDVFENYAMTAGTRFHDFAEKFFDMAGYFEPELWDFFIPEEFGTYERSMAQWFLDFERSRVDLPEPFYPAFLEYEFFDDDHLITGRIDRVDYIDEDEHLIRPVEYKTSSKIDEDSLKRQFGVYTIALENEGFEVDSVRLINPRLKQCVDFERPDTALSQKWIDKIREAYYDPILRMPKCSYAKYAVCQLCRTTTEAGLFLELSDDE